MDGGAWWAAVHGVTKSQTRLGDFTFTFHFHALEKAMAPHSSVLAWRIPWTEEPGGLQSMGSRRVGHDWATSLSLFTFMHWRRKWQPTPVSLRGESQGWRSLVGCSPRGHTESDTTEVTAAAAVAAAEKLTLSLSIYPKYYHFYMTLKEKLLIICFTLFFISLLNLIYNIPLQHISIQISHIMSSLSLQLDTAYLKLREKTQLFR